MINDHELLAVLIHLIIRTVKRREFGDCGLRREFRDCGGLRRELGTPATAVRVVRSALTRCAPLSTSLRLPLRHNRPLPAPLPRPLEAHSPPPTSPSRAFGNPRQVDLGNWGSLRFKGAFVRRSSRDFATTREKGFLLAHAQSPRTSSLFPYGLSPLRVYDSIKSTARLALA